MEKWNGFKIGQWEIVDPDEEKDEDYEYADLSIDELFTEAGFSDEDKSHFLKKYSAVNIHMLTAEETFDDCLELLDDYKTDSRLSKLNAIVFLILKPKGKRNTFHRMSDEKFVEMIHKAQEMKVPIGFDSCSAYRFLSCITDEKKREWFELFAESCESSLFSVYINVEGKMFPCSFVEGEDEWKEGIDVVYCEDFLKDVWYNEKTVAFRNTLIATSKKNDLNCRICPKFVV